MKGLVERVQEASERDEALLAASLAAWGKAAGDHEPKNPLRPLAAHVDRVRDALEQTLAGLPDAGAELEELLPRRGGLAATARVWEFYAGRFRQRHDPVHRDLLRLAGGFAWECWHRSATALEPQAPERRRETPLVAFADHLSPVAQPRVSAIDIQGLTERDTARLGDVIRALPVPIIGLPWRSALDARQLVLVAHEVGHVIEEDYGILPLAEAALAPLDHGAVWRRWACELFADAWGVRHGGLEYAAVLAETLAVSLTDLEVEPDLAAPKEYPPTPLRMDLVFAMCERRGLDPAALRDDWAEALPTSATVLHPQIPAVLDRLGALEVGDGTLFGAAPLPDAEPLAQRIQAGPGAWANAESGFPASLPVRALARCTLDGAATRAACARWVNNIGSSGFLGAGVGAMGPGGATTKRGTTGAELTASLSKLLFT